MIKKIAAAFMAVLVFGGLAYYSGILYLEKSVPENQAYMKAPVVFFPEEQRLEQEEQKEQEKEEAISIAPKTGILSQACGLCPKKATQDQHGLHSWDL